MLMRLLKEFYGELSRLQVVVVDHPKKSMI
jgi:hypothetical protein